MRFKETYRVRDFPNASIGRFYKTDLRKMLNKRNEFPCLVHDKIRDTYNQYYNDLMNGDESLFCTIKEGKVVIGYIVYTRVGSYTCLVQLIPYMDRVSGTHGFKEAIMLGLDFGYSHFNVSKLYTAYVNKLNDFAPLLGRLGFRLEGALTNHIYFDGEPHDVLLYGIRNGG